MYVSWHVLVCLCLFPRALTLPLSLSLPRSVFPSLLSSYSHIGRRTGPGGQGGKAKSRIAHSRQADEAGTPRSPGEVDSRQHGRAFADHTHAQESATLVSEDVQCLKHLELCSWKLDCTDAPASFSRSADLLPSAEFIAC